MTDQQDTLARAAEAREQLKRLRSDASDLAAQSDAASADFTKNPTERAFAKRAVAEQKAVNAAQAVDEFEQASQELFLEERRIQQAEELARLRPKLDWQASIQGDVDKIVTLYADFAEALRSAVQAVNSKLAEHANDCATATELERQVGTGANHRSPDSDLVGEHIRGQIDKRLRLDHSEPIAHQHSYRHPHPFTQGGSFAVVGLHVYLERR